MAKIRETTQIDVHVGIYLRRRRMLIGTSQQEVAKALGVSFQQVQKYEKGTNRISAGRLFLLAKILGVGVADCFEGIAEGAAEMRAAKDEELKRIDEFIQSREGLRLNLAYLGTHDRRIRKSVLDLLEAAQTAPTD